MVLRHCTAPGYAHAVRFDETMLSPILIRALHAQGFHEATPVQAQAIEAAAARKGVLALAPTGSGKTYAYALPVLDALITTPPRRRRGQGIDPRERLRALVLVPTRELAQQVSKDLQLLVRGTVLRVACVYGKSAIAPQREAVSQGIDVLIGTPGRVRELLDDDAVTLAYLTHAIIDEGDRMSDMGFLPQVTQILERAPGDRITMAFSATMPRTLRDTVLGLLGTDPVEVGVGRQNAPATEVGHDAYLVQDGHKVAMLLWWLKHERRNGVAVFCRTRRRVGWVEGALRRHGVAVAMLHGDLSQTRRNQALEAFASGSAKVLVATDVAARGLHVPAIKAVVNYDVPIMLEDFVHRVGRAGHGGGKAQSVTFVAGLDADRWKRIGDFAGVDIPARAAPDLAKFDVVNKGRRAAPAAPTRGTGPSTSTRGARRSEAARRTKVAPERPELGSHPSSERVDRPSWSNRGPRGPQKPRRAGKADRLSRLASSKKLRGLMRKQPLTPDQRPGSGVRKPKA
jgi:ATP-dependent RNA helicase RhlE